MDQPLKIEQHIIAGVPFKASPNYNERPVEEPISLLVVHNISLPPNQFGGDYVERLFCNHLDCSEHPYFSQLVGLEVSAHVFIKRTGEVLQFVPFNKRAWHAGVSQFDGKPNCNDFSIGIELEGADDVPYEDTQYTSLVAVTLALIETYPSMSIENIVGHSDIAPGRKTDPGPAFDWPRFKSMLENQSARVLHN